nr:hypothetical protein [Streptacidiphilus carbonis]
MEAEAPVYAVGDLVHDTKRDRIGTFQGAWCGRMYLRPVAGGGEWEAEPDDVRPADEKDRLRARVAEANDTSRYGRH